MHRRGRGGLSSQWMAQPSIKGEENEARRMRLGEPIYFLSFKEKKEKREREKEREKREEPIQLGCVSFASGGRGQGRIQQRLLSTSQHARPTLALRVCVCVCACVS